MNPAAWAARFEGRFAVVAEPDPEADGRPAGFADLEPDGHIDRFFVSADHQRRGVGRALLDALLAEARRLGLARVFTEASLTARPFFERHGFAVLLDAHSIASECPKLFEGRLPYVNFGTNGGRSCAKAVVGAAAAPLGRQTRFSWVVDGRFKGGHITRHHGRPGDGVHAVQLEMCWSTYMEESPPYRLDPARAARLQPVLRALLQACLDWRP